ncbi:MAG: cytochrome c3 family protein [Planctomycetota bacterium]
MASSRGSITPRALRALAAVSVGAGLSAIAVAGPGNARRDLAERLRYGPGVANHPVHVRPSGAINIPQGWPVEADGSITCLTCHTRLPALEGSTDPHLRDCADSQFDREQFCRRCHVGGDELGGRKMHWQATRFAHLKAADSTSTGLPGRLDAQSQQCLGCHDGVTARESRNTLGSSIVGADWDDRRSHPIGVPYMDAGRGHGEGAYTPASMLPRQVRLPGGRVSCVSCHDLYARDRYLLTIPIEGSELCLTCHDMK